MSKLGTLAAVILFASTPVLAEYQPKALEQAPEKPVTCEWGKMKSDEYQECLQRKSYYEKLKPEDREQQNAQAKQREIELRLERLERKVFGRPFGE